MAFFLLTVVLFNLKRQKKGKITFSPTADFFAVLAGKILPRVGNTGCEGGAAEQGVVARALPPARPLHDPAPQHRPLPAP